MYEQPTKGDLDRNLSVIMHDARRMAMAVRGRIVSEAAAQGGLNSRVPVTIAGAVDGIHRDAIDQAMVVVRNFMERMQLPPKELTGWARPHLENLGDAVLGAIHPAGYPGEHQQAVKQYRAVFQQRLDGALRDAEIGFVKGAGFAQAQQGTALVTAAQPREVLILKPAWFGISIDLKELWRRISKLSTR
jgi:hypothetical protein